MITVQAIHYSTVYSILYTVVLKIVYIIQTYYCNTYYMIVCKQMFINRGLAKQSIIHPYNRIVCLCQKNGRHSLGYFVVLKENKLYGIALKGQKIIYFPRVLGIWTQKRLALNSSLFGTVECYTRCMYFSLKISKI